MVKPRFAVAGPAVAGCGLSGPHMQALRPATAKRSFTPCKGLFFEAYEGGIRKDYATYSYYFVSSGLAFLSLLAFSIIGDVYTAEKGLKPLVMAGKNPMIAYVGVNLVVNPLLNLTGLMEYVNLLNENAWLGFLRGVLLTSVVVAMTMFFSKLKWFWRT